MFAFSHYVRLRRLLGWLVIIGAALFSSRTVAAPAQLNGGRPVTITIQWLPAASGAFDISGKATVAVAQAFMRRYPNVTLRPFTALRPPIGTESSGGETDILMAMAGGVAPDVLTVNFRQSETFISQGFLYPLDAFVKDWQSTPAGRAELRRIIPTEEVWHVIRRIGPDGQPHVWAIPPILYVNTFWYRKDVLRDAGLPPRAPRDWDEFYRMCLRVTDPRQGTYGFLTLKSYWLTPFIWSAGSEVITRDPHTGAFSAGYATPQAVQAAQFYWKLARQPWGICPLDGDHFALDPATHTGTCAHGHAWTADALAQRKLYFQGFCAPDFTPWEQGKQAFCLGYLGDVRMNLQGQDPNLVGIAPMPLGPTGLRGNELNSSMLGINGTVKDPAKIAAAWAYIRFAASEEAKRIQTRVLVDGGYAKYVNPLWLRQFGYTAYLRDTPPGWEETYRIALQSGHPEPYGKNAQQIYNEMDLAWDKIALLPAPDTATITHLLAENAARTNERLFGHITTDETAHRNMVAYWVVLGCAVLFFFLIRLTLNTYGASLQPDAQASRLRQRRLLTGWLVLLPALAGVLLFQYVPLGRGSLMAFQNYQLFGPQPFIGVTNFGNALFAPEFWHALLVSAQYAVLVLALGFFVPVFLALLLHEIPRGSLLYRILFFLPAVTSGIVITLLWKQLYNPTAYGMLNQLFALLHLSPQTFLQDPKLALFWVILPGIWAGMGPGSIIYLAAMQQIPEEYYEAADVDGASFLMKFRAITLPFLKPLLIINFVGACVGAFKSFEPIWIMTGGGPAGATNVLGLEIWRNAFMYLHYGYATAMGWLLASLLIGFTIFQLSYLSKVQFRLAKSE